MANAIISIIDDDVAVRKSLESLLRSANFDVEGFGSAEEFLSSGGPVRADCIISDIYMSGISGIELKRRLNADRCFTPFILITGAVEDRLEELVKTVGVVSFLSKPVKVAVLLSAVGQAIRGSEKK